LELKLTAGNIPVVTGVTFNRTIFGIETQYHIITHRRYLLLIAPFLELKHPLFIFSNLFAQSF